MVIAVSLALLAIGTSRGAVSGTADYSIAAIEYQPGPLDKIGALRAGLICLPKGALRWRDVSRPADAEVVRALSVALVAKGLPVAMPPDVLFSDAPPATAYRIKVVVETVKLRLCVAGSSLVKQTPSGHGSVVVRWETYDRVKRTLSAKQAFAVPLLLDGRDPRGSATVLSDAIVETAVRYAASRAP